jgi:hypothetical protein
MGSSYAENHCRRGRECGPRDDFLDLGLLLALGRAVIAGEARLHVADFAERFDQLVIGIVKHIPADRRDPFIGLDV